jgi:hypothetical protein
MPNKLGLINHGQDILRTMRRDTWSNRYRFMHAEVKYNVRVATIAMYITGIAFSVGFFWGVAIS